MNFAQGLFYSGFEWFGWIITVLSLVMGMLAVPWRSILGDSPLQNRFLGCAVVLAFLWQMSVNLNIGVVIHFMGMTTLTLFFWLAFSVASRFYRTAGRSLFALAAMAVFWPQLSLQCVSPRYGVMVATRQNRAIKAQ